MKRYNPEYYTPFEYYRCKYCNNVTFSTLPRTTDKLTELSFCSQCGVGILFSTIAEPVKVGTPRNRWQWGEPVEVMSFSTLKKTNYLQAPLF